jgi:hypothetical protein
MLVINAVGKKLKHRRVGNEWQLTRCLNVVSFLCLCSPVKIVYFFLFIFVSASCVIAFLRLMVTNQRYP